MATQKSKAAKLTATLMMAANLILRSLHWKCLQGPSPDEVALVEGARQVGFEFKNRSMSSVTLSVFGEEVVFEVLNVMEYTSER